MTERAKQVLVRLVLGSILGAVLAPLACSVMFGPDIGGVRPELAEAVGYGTALVVQSLLGALFGAVVLLATLPFADDGKELVLRSLIHFTATSGTFCALLLGAKWVRKPVGILPWILVLGTLYLLIWLGRWIGWYREVVQLRTMLGLAPGPSPLRWRESVSYLPFALLICDVMPALLYWADWNFAVDVPVFSGLLYPFLCLPIVGFCSGLSLGRRHGLCWLYSLFCLLCYLPTVIVLYRHSILLHCCIVVISTLAGTAFGWLYWKKKV